MLTITYTGEPIRLDTDKFTKIVEAGTHEMCVPHAYDDNPGQGIAGLWLEAVAQKVVIVPDDLRAEVYGDDDSDGSGFVPIVFPNPSNGSSAGVTCGWRDADNLWIDADAEWTDGEKPEVIKDALEWIIGELNAALGVRAQ